MNGGQRFPLVAVDVGNSQVMAGLFGELPTGNGVLPQPDRTLALEGSHWEPVEIALWLAPLQPADVCWRLASVREDTRFRLQEWLREEGCGTRQLQLTHDQLPLAVSLQKPAEIGIDRLLAAVAANQIRPVDRPAVVIDLGSAITVDVVSREGAFSGGAILPGMRMSAQALSHYTDKLPEVPIGELNQVPAPLGRSTNEAICSGLYWGAVGAIRTLVAQLRAEMQIEPLILLTGGGAAAVVETLGSEVRYEPYLILSGIAMVQAQPVQGPRE
jgi:type III pantothenate kinase